ncbi:MAG: hypothetical protein IJS37_01080 [Bacilli bacterium]|nr:hypothetical protein [Bacilli bacterium]
MNHVKFALPLLALALSGCGGGGSSYDIFHVSSSSSVVSGPFVVSSQSRSTSTPTWTVPSSSSRPSGTSSRTSSTYYTPEEKVKLGITPTQIEHTNGLTYGLYPQDLVTSKATIAGLTTLDSHDICLNGWYQYKGEYYAKVIATPYESALDGAYEYFIDGTAIKKGETYWFLVQPITWRILTSNNNRHLLVTGGLLDKADCYYSSRNNRTISGSTVYPNNYMYSSLRNQLTVSFYNTAFALNDQYIPTVTVDNSASSIPGGNATYACPNTQDKIFAFSYDECGRTPYLNSEGSRVAMVSDYARARGAWAAKASDYVDYGNWWMRSPSNQSEDWACYNSYKGRRNSDYFVTVESVCIRPGIYLDYRL